MKNRKIRVLIVDDHPIVREGLVSLLSRQTGFEVCGEAADLAEALQLVASTRPDVVTIDLSLENGSGLELIRRIAESEPEIRMVACSLFDEMLYGERVLQAGAHGYVNKQEATRTIVTAIRQVCSGKTYLSERLSQFFAQRMIGSRKTSPACGVESLSDRELEIFQLIGSGLTTTQIAEKLHIGGKTVETHRRRMKVKLNTPSNAQLTRDATQWVLEHG